MFGKVGLIAALMALGACSAATATPAPPPVPVPVPVPDEVVRVSKDIARFASVCEDFDDWDKPTAPFQIHGNTWYVGTCGITAILIVGDRGLVLIDTGTEPGSKVVESNIKALGHAITDVKAILTSHEHFDHVGGMARLQALSGAAIYTSAAAAPVLRTGKDNPADPQAGLHAPMAPVAGDIRTVGGGETLSVAGLAIRGITTPGHTVGAMSWQWESCAAGQCQTIVLADSLSPISADGYRFTDHPEFIAAFRKAFVRLRALECGMLLTPHPSASDMLTRAATGTLVGGMTCAAYADSKSKALDERLAKEGAAR